VAWDWPEYAAAAVVNKRRSWPDLTLLTRAHKIRFVTCRTAAMAAVTLFTTLLVGCSEAPSVPIQPTNRRVLAELISEIY